MTITATERRTPLPRARVIVFLASVAASLPYAALKIAWLTGSNLGITDSEAEDLMHSAETEVANALTLALELGSIGIVAALTFGWGRRLPPLLVLGPIWVGSGLLAPIAIGLPAGLVVQGFAGGSPAPGENGLEGWVFAVVYGGFVAQAPLLVAAFVMYAVSRWPWAFHGRVGDISPGTTAELQRVIAGLGIVGTGLYAAAHLLWTIDGSSGMDTAAQRTFLFVGGALPLAGALAVLTLVRRRHRVRLASRLPVAWVGSGTAFVAFLLPSKDVSGFEAFVNSVGAISGVGMAVAALLVLVDARDSASPAL